MTRQSTRSASTNDFDATDPALDAVAPASALESVLDAAGVVVDECIVEADSDGLAVTAIDAATVGMVDLSLSADVFEHYESGPIRFGVNLDRLQAVVGMADADGTVELAIDDASRTLHVCVGELAYTLALIDPDAIRSPPDTVAIAADLDAAVTVDGDAIARAIDAGDMVGDTLAVGIDTDERTLYAHADGDTDAVDFELAAADCHDFDPVPAHSLFSVDYLAELTRVLPGDDPVDVHLDEEAPIAFTFDVADGDGTVDFLVAPRLSKS